MLRLILLNFGLLGTAIVGMQSPLSDSFEFHAYTGTVTDKQVIESIVAVYPYELDCTPEYALHYSQKPGYITVMLYCNRLPAGFINYSKSDPDNIAELDRPHGLIHLVAVDRAFQGLGLGSLLLNYAITYLAYLGVQEIILWVKNTNYRAQKMYASCGFFKDQTDGDCTRFKYQVC